MGAYEVAAYTLYFAITGVVVERHGFTFWVQIIMSLADKSLHRHYWLTRELHCHAMRISSVLHQGHVKWRAVCRENLRSEEIHIIRSSLNVFCSSTIFFQLCKCFTTFKFQVTVVTIRFALLSKVLSRRIRPESYSPRTSWHFRCARLFKIWNRLRYEEVGSSYNPAHSLPFFCLSCGVEQIRQLVRKKSSRWVLLMGVITERQKSDFYHISPPSSRIHQDIRRCS